MNDAVLVTGASRGIGLEIARVLVARGHAVIGVHRRGGPHVQAVAKDLGELFRPVRSDLTRSEEMRGLLHFVALTQRPLRGVVLNAGITHRGTLSSMNVDDDGGDPLIEQLRINLEAPLRLLRVLLQRDLLRAGSSIVVVTSNLARRGLPGKVAYAASKAGLEGAVRALAHELGPSGIRVNAVAPGLLRTDMTADMTEDDFAAYAGQVPLRRAGTPGDIAPLVAFLLGEGAGYITGQIIDVDGGWAA